MNNEVLVVSFFLGILFIIFLVLYYCRHRHRLSRSSSSFTPPPPPRSSTSSWSSSLPKDVVVTSWFSFHWTSRRWNTWWTLSSTWQPWWQSFYWIGAWFGCVCTGLLVFLLMVMVFFMVPSNRWSEVEGVPESVNSTTTFLKALFLPHDWQWSLWKGIFPWGAFPSTLAFLLHYFLILAFNVVWHEVGHGLAAAAYVDLYG
ncbi:hypothetical protein HMI54_012055 [Coelomomyces lativittatus]|nr:hypothetical protein HMI54_012055 [Coelomomyces lativittatus]KAJ1503086.1 hypothetical protein HMI56_002348 [Coelomomyces lativittatus]